MGQAFVENGVVNSSILFVGMSVANANVASVLRFLRPDLAMVGVDALPEPGYLWSKRFWHYQNNTIGPSRVGGGNLPRSGGDLFPLGNFGAIRMGMITYGRWPTGDVAGTAMRWNFHRDLDAMVLGYEVVDVERMGPKQYKVTLKCVSDGSIRQMGTSAIVASGVGEQVNPFDDPISGILDEESFDIWEKEMAKLDRGEIPNVFSYDGFGMTLGTTEGKRHLLMENEDGSPRRWAVGGAGDGGNCVVAVGLGRAPPATYDGLNWQEMGARPRIRWYGQNAKTSRSFSDKSRGVYAQNCVGFNNGQIQPTIRKVGALRRTENGIAVIAKSPATEQLRYPMEEQDVVVMATGFKQSSVYDGPLRRIARRAGGTEGIRDSDGRVVLAKLYDEDIYLAGVRSGIPPAGAGEGVSEIFESLGIPENQVANWWRGWSSQRGGAVLARDLPIGPSYLRYAVRNNARCDQI